MTQKSSARRVCVGFVMAAVMAFALPTSAQTEEVQSRVVTQQAATRQVAVDPLAAWQIEYAKATDAAQQLQASESTREFGEQLELDLAAYNEALKAYVRVSERLRHKDRALTAAMETLKNSGQADSRVYQTLSNAQKAAHDTPKNMINNIR